MKRSTSSSNAVSRSRSRAPSPSRTKSKTTGSRAMRCTASASPASSVCSKFVIAAPSRSCRLLAMAAWSCARDQEPARAAYQSLVARSSSFCTSSTMCPHGRSRTRYARPSSSGQAKAKDRMRARLAGEKPEAPGKAVHRSAESRRITPGVRRPRSRPSSAWRRTISRPICQYTSINSALIARAALACALRIRTLMSARNSS